QLEKRRTISRTLSLDLYDQYETMEKDGKWRFSSPTHAVLAFYQALKELEAEGGIYQGYMRYLTNNQLLRQKMEALGYQ
ncbi:2-aminoethylphosphonate--pyruvate transaminase, partial [Enterococcus faecalis]